MNSAQNSFFLPSWMNCNSIQGTTIIHSLYEDSDVENVLLIEYVKCMVAKQVLDSAVSIVAGLKAGGSGFSAWQSRFFLFATTSRLVIGTTQPSVQQVSRFYPWGKMKVTTYFLSNSKINMWSYTFTPRYVCIVWRKEARNSFTFLYCFVLGFLQFDIGLGWYIFRTWYGLCISCFFYVSSMLVSVTV